jgi:hypothetical protein
MRNVPVVRSHFFISLIGLTGTLAFCDLTFESSLRSLEVTVALNQKVLENISQDCSRETHTWRASCAQSGVFDDSYCRRSSTQERTTATDKGTSSDFECCIASRISDRAAHDDY